MGLRRSEDSAASTAGSFSSSRREMASSWARRQARGLVPPDAKVARALDTMPGMSDTGVKVSFALAIVEGRRGALKGSIFCFLQAHTFHPRKFFRLNGKGAIVPCDHSYYFLRFPRRRLGFVMATCWWPPLPARLA
jgi:hypothetical protein